MTELFNLHPELFNSAGMTTLLLRLLLNLCFTLVVVFGVYAKRYGKNEHLFTYVMFNLITFTLCFLLRQVPIELGFALGLFAVFGILRYRTEPIRITDLTYLFVVIGIGILNAVVNEHISLGEVLLVNGAIVGMTAVLELSALSRRDLSVRVTYDALEQLQDSDPAALIAELEQRTGLSITKVSIDRLDLLRDNADLTIYYRQEVEK